MRGALREGVVVRALTLAPLVVGLGLMTAMAVILRRTYGGDAAIYLPYARNLADGHPFSFNPGQFSSGSTSPLWVVVLSVPYLLGLGYKGAKAFAVLSTGGAYVASFLAARRVSGSAPAAGIAALWVVVALPLYGLIMFESSLVVLVVALGIWLLAPLLRRPAAEVGTRQLAPLVVAWAALPLARPEAAVLVPIEAGALLLSWHGGRRQLGRLALAVGIASLPALAYYGYSLARLGVPSTSVAGRALYLRETSTHRLGPLFLSSEGLDYLTSWPAVAAFVPGVAGLVLLARRAGMRVLAWTALAGVGAYVFLVTFVSPGAFDTPRYLLPIAPLLVVGIALAIRALPGAPLQVAGALAAAAVLAIASGQTVDGAHNLASTPYSFDTITQRSAAGIVNGLAHPGDQVLAYEVQSRYFLRPDVRVLSLDGITDGKVFPYEHRTRVTAFLHRYRPRFWIADTATDSDRRRPGVALRRYLQGSVLTDVVRRVYANPRPRRVVAGGIEFRLLAWRRALPLRAGVWTMVFELRYA